MNLSEFDYNLPEKFIAQNPLTKRDQSKLMVLNRKNKTINHYSFFQLPELLDSNSVLVLNKTKVIPARLQFKINNTNAEILLVKQIEGNIWQCMVKPGSKFKSNSNIQIDKKCLGIIKSITSDGLRIIDFKCDNFNLYIKKHGITPTPPYIKEKLNNPDKYQTIYAENEGSIAAPTAGFHFTEKVLNELKSKNIKIEFITLHIGIGTFQPVKKSKIEEHKMHNEWFELSEKTAERLNKAKKQGKKIISVGTTTVRVLESCANNKGVLTAKSGETDIFIYPGYKWKFTDQIITNFHIPKSTLLMLISSFCTPKNNTTKGRDFILKAYKEAQKHNYRFFSFGDSMFIS